MNRCSAVYGAAIQVYAGSEDRQKPEANEANEERNQTCTNLGFRVLLAKSGVPKQNGQKGFSANLPKTWVHCPPVEGT